MIAMTESRVNFRFEMSVAAAAAAGDDENSASTVVRFTGGATVTEPKCKTLFWRSMRLQVCHVNASNGSDGGQEGQVKGNL